MIRPILSAMNAGRLRLPDLLVGVVLLFALGWPLYQIWPMLLPVRILEGPFLQQSTQSGGTVVWTQSRAAQSTLQLNDGTRLQSVTSAADGMRYAASIDGLSPAQAYAYSIRLGADKELFAGGVLQTAKTPDSAFRFIVFGDSGKGFFEQYELGKLMSKYEPDFLLHTGDIIYGGGERDRYPNRFFAPYQPMLQQITFWPCIGNHDDENVEGFEAVFSPPHNGPAGLPPEHNYWFDYADARIAVIDSMAPKATVEEQIAPWLDQVFADADATWRFVAFHHPPYSAGNYGPNQALQEALVPAVDRNAVDIVFNGHDHVYERMVPMRAGSPVAPGEGTVYVVTGMGGGPLNQLRPKAEQPAYIAASYDRNFSFTLISIDADGLKLQQIALGDEIVDTYDMTPRNRQSASASDDAKNASPDSDEDGAP
ncbi:MAG: metallophosphoesterase [Phycisphaerae bacterium]